jgi:hypothetical protein
MQRLEQAATDTDHAGREGPREIAQPEIQSSPFPIPSHGTNDRVGQPRRFGSKYVHRTCLAMFCVRANIGLGRHIVVIRTDDARLRSLEHPTFLIKPFLSNRQPIPRSVDARHDGMIADGNDR